jgi:hypothetical protein
MDFLPGLVFIVLPVPLVVLGLGFVLRWVLIGFRHPDAGKYAQARAGSRATAAGAGAC